MCCGECVVQCGDVLCFGGFLCSVGGIDCWVVLYVQMVCLEGCVV